MFSLYTEQDAFYPRLKTDRFFIDRKNTFKFNEITHKTALFTESQQLLDKDLWKRFVNQFTFNSDGDDKGWRGEYWGKMMRGGCMVYAYTKNPALLATLKEAVVGILETEDNRGRISTYSVADEFDGWDMWSRKYVLLGLQHFIEISDDAELNEKIVRSMCRQVDYLISKIGPQDQGKLSITRTSRHWYGLNSSSILEPVVRLYTITGEEKYLDFAKYIADTGCTYAGNVFKLAHDKQLRLYQFPVTKAYEMISCFEGLLELYRIIGTDWYKIALLNFADMILEDEFTVIGSAGCTHELFDHSVVRQANTTNYYIMQETCVTVTLMKFFVQLNLLTGNSKYMDAFETSYYNAYLGAVNTKLSLGSPAIFNEAQYSHLKQVVLPFDSYSPLTSGTRGGGLGGLRPMKDGKYYGCCVCIAAAGVGLVPKASCLTAKDGLTLNMYIDGEIHTFSPSGNPVDISIKTEYPAQGKVLITLNPEVEETFTLRLRNPRWSKSICKKDGKNVAVSGGYIEISDLWKKGDRVELELDMSVEVIRPIPYGSQILMNHVVWGTASVTVPAFDREDPLAKNHLAFRRGPIMLAQDKELGSDPDIAVSPDMEGDLVKVETFGGATPFETILAVKLPLKDGGSTLLCDYASAGKRWNEEDKIAVWIRTE